MIYKGEVYLLKYIILVCGLATIILSSYQLITSDNQLMPYTQLIMSVMLLLLGIDEFKKQRKSLGYFLVFTAIFGFVVSVQMLVF